MKRRLIFVLRSPTTTTTSSQCPTHHQTFGYCPSSSTKVGNSLWLTPFVKEHNQYKYLIEEYDENLVFGRRTFSQTHRWNENIHNNQNEKSKPLLVADKSDKLNSTLSSPSLEKSSSESKEGKEGKEGKKEDKKKATWSSYFKKVRVFSSTMISIFITVRKYEIFMYSNGHSILNYISSCEIGLPN